MKPPDETESTEFMHFLISEPVRPNALRTSGALAYTSIALMFVGVSLSFYVSRMWGGMQNELAEFFAVVLLCSAGAFICSSNETTKKFAAGVMLGFWIGCIESDRLWWGLAGVVVQALACYLEHLAEKFAPKEKDGQENFEERLFQWNWKRAHEGAENVATKARKRIDQSIARPPNLPL
jgi:hypothetical protein